MRFNSDEVAIFAMCAGDHEGRLTHKPPPRTLYDTAYKERWFKLKSNFLFYYRLNEFGAVEKNEPNGVYVLENMEVQREEEADLPFGFAIKWKDDPEKKQMFFAKSEDSVQTWINKIVQASYDHMRAQLIMLRVQMRRRTGKDPFEHCGTPLPQRAAMSLLSQPSSLQGLTVSQSSDNLTSFNPPSLRSNDGSRHSAPGSPSNYGVSLRMKAPKSPLLRMPSRTAPVPPPRRGRKQEPVNGEDLDHSDEVQINSIGRNKATFKSHLFEDPPSLLD